MSWFFACKFKYLGDLYCPQVENTLYMLLCKYNHILMYFDLYVVMMWLRGALKLQLQELVESFHQLASWCNLSLLTQHSACDFGPDGMTLLTPPGIFPVSGYMWSRVYFRKKIQPPVLTKYKKIKNLLQNYSTAIKTFLKQKYQKSNFF